MKIESWLHILVFLLLCGCSGGGGEEEVTPPTEPETPKVQIALNCGIPGPRKRVSSRETRLVCSW